MKLPHNLEATVVGPPSTPLLSAISSCRHGGVNITQCTAWLGSHTVRSNTEEINERLGDL